MSADMDAAKADELVRSLSPDEQYTLLRAVLRGDISAYRIARAMNLELDAWKVAETMKEIVTADYPKDFYNSIE